MKSSQKKSKQEKKKEKKQRKAQSLQKKNKEESNQSESDEDIDLNQIQEQQEEEIQINFLVGEIRQQYYHSLKTILLRIGQITKVTNSELADAIVANKNIGNVSLADDQDDEEDEEEDQQNEGQQEDDEENVYSVLTVLPGNHKVSKSLKKLTLNSMQKNKIQESIQDIVKNDDTGVLINERLTNLPAFVVNSTHEVFKSDIIDLKNKDKATYNKLFSGYLLNISQIQFEGSYKLEDIIFSKFEDYQMCKRAKKWWLGQKNHTLKKKSDLRNLYYLISAQEYLAGVQNIKTYLE